MDAASESLCLYYEIRDPYHYTPRVSLAVPKPGGGAVRFRTRETVRRTPFAPEARVRVRDEVLAAVMELLRGEEELFTLTRLTEPPAELPGLRGYRFCFDDGERRAAITADELAQFGGDHAARRRSRLVFSVLARVGNLLIPEGIDAACFTPDGEVGSFLPAGDEEDAPEAPAQSDMPPEPEPETAGNVCEVYSFRTAAKPRWVNGRELLERYAIEKTVAGSYLLLIDIDRLPPSPVRFPIPADWFDHGWEGFLVLLTANFPADEYGFSREELLRLRPLREFLGFGA